ncbi:C2H2-type zinc finger protein [Aspergillus ibericus CBS 121593]|uniref:C2H2-type domain-containing protein n=1 Tax=Aspergillus ibericus CBS 121593 TaxID=1448316 RepID=A0A395GM18_9EURO|nr:hypothetical protein BO80DRAFT_225077 [Aspergillus ibericus CBS 121593]RAK96519.1 hypothetical protein BO80DRAFT_225077 [Aspergillus ibericus CBS 121593]
MGFLDALTLGSSANHQPTTRTTTQSIDDGNAVLMSTGAITTNLSRYTGATTVLTGVHRGYPGTVASTSPYGYVRDVTNLDSTALHQATTQGTIHQPATGHGEWGYSPQYTPDIQSTDLRCEWRGCTYRNTFNRPADLIRHVRNLHVAPRSFACYMCGRRFNQAYNLRNHMRVHQHTDVPSVCP